MTNCPGQVTYAHLLTRGEVEVRGGVEGREGRDQVVETRERYKVHGDLVKVNIQRALKS